MLSLQELRTSSVKELQEELAKSRKKLLKTHMGTRSKQEKDTSKIKKLKRYIAASLTVMNEIERKGK